MSTSANSEQISSLLQQVKDKTSAFQSQNAEPDRVAAIKAAQGLLQALQSPQESVVNISYQPTHFLCLRIGIDLDVFNTLAKKNGPVTVDELAAVKGADPVLVQRVMRILEGIQYVNQEAPNVYSANDMTRHMTDRLFVARVTFVWHGMNTLTKTPEFLRKTNFKNPEGATGGPFTYAENFDETVWVWFAQSQEGLDTCNTFMEANQGSRPSWLEWFPIKEQIIDGFDASKGDVLLVDVAGGRGHDIEALHRKLPGHPGRLVVEDLPHVIDDIKSLDSSIEKVKFNLFDKQSVEGARAYYLKFIMHDWNDEDCRKILGHIAAAMKKGYSKLIIEEFILGDTHCAMLHAMWDWEMMIFCNSMERTASQLQRLLQSTGFKLNKFWYPPGDGQGIIEAELE